jgi:hypothetical protein
LDTESIAASEDDGYKEENKNYNLGKSLGRLKKKENCWISVSYFVPTWTTGKLT